MREDAAAAIELASRAIKLNPLDRDLQSLTADAHLLAGRQAALAGDLEAARNAFRTALRFGSGIEDPAVLACWAVAEAKAGNTTEANELRARMAAHPHLRAMDVFWTLTETIRLKAKPAEKKAAEKAFAELLAGPPQAETVTALAAVLSNLSERPINYHGYKTHHKKMVDYVTKAVRIPGGYHDEQRQAICEALIDLKLSKALTAHASQAIKESRENPWFHFYLIEAEYLLPPNRRRNNYRLLETFTQAERLARASNDPRAKELLDLLADRRREMQIIDPEMMFDLLFGRGDPNAR
jgi:tetratricopeptide (TPR) repeat protein